ncbi:putative transporter [Pseudocercospora fuligena]|uniref:Putative transporter n=1 Tax=Pseudocercospora fuligena TaxID=685502 RepID=A0A8H6VNL2_9PEZI|nr:putative transporter [Pseudocercospora fuligena]
MTYLEKQNLEQTHTNTTDAAELEQPVKVDTVHGDEATKVLANYNGPLEWTSSEEKKLVRKVDRRLLSILVLTYGLQYYDKAMLSQAALFGLRDDLALRVGNRYSMSSAIFYLGFICGAYPAIVLSQRYPIERVMAGIVCLWGICLICTAAVHNYQSLFAQRFFLGFLEAGVSPGWMMVVGGWYKKREQAFRMGAWYSATGYVSIFAPLINYGLGHINGALSPWRYMYLVAGAITIAWSALIYFLMPPDPIRAKRFEERERYIAVARLRENNAGVRNTHFKIGQVKELVMDLKFWLLFLIAFFMLFVNGPVSTFIPIIINQLGFTGFTSLLLIMPAGAIIGTVELMAPFCAMKFKNARCWIIVVTVAFSLVGSILLWQLPIEQTGGRLFAVYILAFYGGGYACLMGLTVANCAGYTKRSVSSSGIFVGYCLGNFVGPLIFYENEAPYYNTGWITTVVSLIVTIVLTIVYRYVCVWDNRQRDKTGSEAFDHAYEDDFTDKTNKQFRYTL